VKQEVEARVECYRKLGMDMVGSPYGVADSFVSKPLGPNQVLGEWAELYEAKPPYSGLWYVRGTINGPADYEAFQKPDPCASGRLEMIRETVRQTRGEMAVLGQAYHGWKQAFQMRGISGILTDLYLRPSFAERMLKDNNRFFVEVIKGMIDSGADVVSLQDDFADVKGPWMPPSLFRRFLAPIIRNAVETIHKGGVPAVLHCDGNLYPVLDDLVTTGIDGLHAIEPAAGMDIGRVKELHGDRICLLGNIDCSITLPLGTVVEVEAEVQGCIAKAAQGGGHVLTSSNSIHDSVKVENLLAMISAARRYGVYTHGVQAQEPLRSCG